MKVRATKLGFYDQKRRKEGDVFILHDPKLFSENWMEAIDGKPPVKSKPKGKPKIQKPIEVSEPEVSLEDDVI